MSSATGARGSGPADPAQSALAKSRRPLTFQGLRLSIRRYLFVIKFAASSRGRQAKIAQRPCRTSWCGFGKITEACRLARPVPDLPVALLSALLYYRGRKITGQAAADRVGLLTPGGVPGRVGDAGLRCRAGCVYVTDHCGDSPWDRLLGGELTRRSIKLDSGCRSAFPAPPPGLLATDKG
jgi:hypothetical protein